MAHAQKPDFVVRRKGRVHFNRRGRQFIRLLAAEVCASAVVMLDKPCPKVVWRVLATHSIRQFPLHFASRASPCAITFQLDSTCCALCLEHTCVALYRRDEQEWREVFEATWRWPVFSKTQCLRTYCITFATYFLTRDNYGQPVSEFRFNRYCKHRSNICDILWRKSLTVGWVCTCIADP